MKGWNPKAMVHRGWELKSQKVISLVHRAGLSGGNLVKTEDQKTIKAFFAKYCRSDML